MLLEDFLKQCVLLRSLAPMNIWTDRQHEEYSAGTIMLGSLYQQWTYKRGIYKQEKQKDGWERMVKVGDEDILSESIYVYPYMHFLNAKPRYSVHRLKNPFSRFTNLKLDRFQLLYDAINRVKGVADFSKFTPIKITAKTEFKEVELENKNGRATIKTNGKEIITPTIDQTVFFTE